MDRWPPGFQTQYNQPKLKQDASYTHPFEAARNSFLASLTREDRALYSPCASATDLQLALKKLDNVARRKLPLENTLKTIEKFNIATKPYFQIIEMFITSNPEVAALVWGGLRLIFQLASNFVTFFDKLTGLLEHLIVSFTQYTDILELCLGAGDRLPPRMAKLLEEVYKDILQIFHAAVRVFTRSDGRLKKTPFVIGDLLWKPFDSRFMDVSHRLLNHRKALFEEIQLWHVDAAAKERASEAASRGYMQQRYELEDMEWQEAKKERDLSQEERRLMAIERAQNAETRAKTSLLLIEVRQALRAIEQERIKRNYEDCQKWVCPPNFCDARDKAQHIRHDQTALWIFQDPIYRRWLAKNLPAERNDYSFGSNVMWIYGNPGAGKTILASSIIDHLQMQADVDGEVYYFFFQHNSPKHNSIDAAYRSILAQVLFKHHNNTELLDKVSFLRNNKRHAQPTAPDMMTRDILRLCLTSKAILVVDGIDECNDAAEFVYSMLDLWKTSRSSVIMLSRVNVDPLKRAISIDGHLRISKTQVSHDILLFCRFQVERLLIEGFLPVSSWELKVTFADSLSHGADGMFLWARLMINFLRSSSMTPAQRKAVITKVNVPEGLERMYERIIRFVKTSGKHSENLAAKLLTLLIHAVAPLSSRQIRQALIADKVLPTLLDDEPIEEFENAAIMACAGLVERDVVAKGYAFLDGETSLRVIHLSVNEVLLENHSIHSIIPQNPTPMLEGAPLKLISDVASANLEYTNGCLQQLLFHTPAQPLSGRFHSSISAKILYERFCFTDYSAVFWLAHLQKCIDVTRIPDSTDYREGNAVYTKHFLGLLSNLSSALWTFLRTPKTLSVWLEAFYTTEYKDGYDHPWTCIINNFTTWARQPSEFLIPRPLVEMLDDFTGEIDAVIYAWADRLRESPSIIWDEMTAFAHTQRFFFSPESTEVAYQHTPQSLDHRTNTRPAVQVSQTSGSGESKGVLTIWAPALYHDREYKSRVSGDKDVDLNDICSGWTAIYEVWKLYPVSSLACKVEMPLDPGQMVGPMHAYFYHQYSTQIDLPTAISPDNTAFSVLETVYVLKQTSAGVYCHPCRFPIHPALRLGFIWNRPLSQAWKYERPDTYSTTFSSDSRTIALLEWERSGSQHLTVFTYRRDNDVAIEKSGSLYFDPGVQKIEKITFHPMRPFIAFLAFSLRSNTDWRSAVIFWQYQRLNSSAIVSKLNSGELYEAEGFSSCGEHFLVRVRFTFRVITVAVPQSCLEYSSNTAHASYNRIPRQPEGTIMNLNRDSQVLGLAPEPSSHILNQAWSVSTTGVVSALNVETLGNEIFLSQTSDSHVQAAAKMVSLPQ